MIKMKKFLLIFMLLSPLTIMAHSGHGISGSELLHLFVSHYYIAIGFALVVAGVAVYRKHIKTRS